MCEFRLPEEKLWQLKLGWVNPSLFSYFMHNLVKKTILLHGTVHSKQWLSTRFPPSFAPMALLANLFLRPLNWAEDQWVSVVICQPFQCLAAAQQTCAYPTQLEKPCIFICFIPWKADFQPKAKDRRCMEGQTFLTQEVSSQSYLRMTDRRSWLVSCLI